MKRNTLEKLGWPRDVEGKLKLNQNAKYLAPAGERVFVIVSGKDEEGSTLSFDVVRETLAAAIVTAQTEAWEFGEFRTSYINVVLEVTRRVGRALFLGKTAKNYAELSKLGTLHAVDGERCERIGADGFLSTCVSRQDSTKCNACIRRMERVSRSA